MKCERAFSLSAATGLLDTTQLRPKSPSFALPFSIRRMFADLTSLWNASRSSQTALHWETANGLALVAQLFDPPYCARGYRYTYRTYVVQVSQGTRYTPPSLPHRSLGPGGGGRGCRSSSCPLEGIALSGGIAEIVSPIAVEWATKPRGGGAKRIARFWGGGSVGVLRSEASESGTGLVSFSARRMTGRGQSGGECILGGGFQNRFFSGFDPYQICI